MNTFKSEKGQGTLEGIIILLVFAGIVWLALSILGGSGGLTKEWFFALCKTGAGWACQMH